MFNEGKLLGQSVRKRLSGKNPELTQNQVCIVSFNLHQKLQINSCNP